MAVKGVDLSEMNGAVDFQALKNAGVQFVILRCGYGSDFTHQDDKRFGENVAKAQAAGLPWGCYLYSYAVDRDMARSEAAHTLRLLDGRKPPYGVWYDVEDPSQAGADLVGICEAYCGAVEAAGLYVGIYSMLSWLNGKLNSSRLDRYDKWVAQWNSTCDYQKPYGIWQFTDRWSIGGKLFDGNYAYKDYPALTGGAEQEEDYDRGDCAGLGPGGDRRVFRGPGPGGDQRLGERGRGQGPGAGPAVGGQRRQLPAPLLPHPGGGRRPGQPHCVEKGVGREKRR